MTNCFRSCYSFLEMLQILCKRVKVRHFPDYFGMHLHSCTKIKIKSPTLPHTILTNEEEQSFLRVLAAVRRHNRSTAGTFSHSDGKDTPHIPGSGENYVHTDMRHTTNQIHRCFCCISCLDKTPIPTQIMVVIDSLFTHAHCLRHIPSNSGV